MTEKPCKLLDQVLYREVLHQDLGPIEPVYAQKPQRLPVALTRDEMRQVLAQMTGLHQLVKTTMIYTHVLNRGPLGVRSPLDLE